MSGSEAQPEHGPEDVPPSSQGHAPEDPGARARLWGLAVGVFIAGIVLLALNVGDLTRAAGWTGINGVIGSVTCHDVGEHRRYQECAGTFRSSDGRTTAANVVISGGRNPDPAGTVPATMSSDRQAATLTGPGEIPRSLSGVVLGAGMLIGGGWGVALNLIRLDRHFHYRPRKIPTHVRAVPAYVLAVTTVTTIVLWIESFRSH